MKKLQLSHIMSQTKKIKNFFMNRGLRFRLVVFFAVISLLPLLTLGFFSYYKSSSTIKDITGRYSNDIVNEINTNMLLRFKNINDIGKILLNNTTVKEILSKDLDDPKANFNEDNLRMSLLLKTIKDSNENISSVYILSDKNTNIFAVGNITEEHGLVFLNKEYREHYKDSDLYKETVKADNNIWWPTQNVLGKSVFILTEKLYNEEMGVLGVLVVHLDVGIMDGIYSNIKTGKNSTAYLIDNNGRILFHADKTRIGKQISNSDILRKVRKSEEASFIIQEDNKPMFVVYNTFSVTNWKSIVITSYNELISDATNIRDATLIISIACLLFVLFFSVIITRSILNPIQKLMQLMKKGSAGDMKVRFNALYNDEIGQLGNSFNKMMSDIEKLIHLVEHESNQKVEAEIKVLESQINPHFLYNTLASIYWSAMASGNNQIGEMAASLSKFFKLGLNKGKEFTTVEKEVEHVKEYLIIQKMLYKNMFSYQVYIDPQVLNYRTIKLILQPLAENSLQHGFEKKKEMGFIKIEVQKVSDRIVFKVMDNGTGIKNFTDKSLKEIIDNGYGIKNIYDRLKLYFNNDFEILCKSIPDIETVFEVSIPAKMAEEVFEDA